MPDVRVAMQELERVLPPAAMLPPSDVALAFGTSVAAVYGWIDAGLVEAINISSGDKTTWRVSRRSVLAFAAERSNLNLNTDQQK